AVKRMNRNDITRGRIFDQLTEQFGGSVLGMYDNKLRIEVIDDEGKVFQFSLTPVVHKDLVEESDCEPYVCTDERIRLHEETLAKNAPKPKKKKKTTSPGKINQDNIAAVVEAAKNVLPTLSKEEEIQKLDSLMSDLGL
ncbi:MAG: hypothetical protein RR744_08300, partial [Cellulosilyticaceae bacterium]